MGDQSLGKESVQSKCQQRPAANRVELGEFYWGSEGKRFFSSFLVK